MVRIENPYIRFILCLLVCICLLFCSVAQPLMLPARAFTGIEESAIFFLLQTLILSLGYSLAVDFDGTTDTINQMLEDLGDSLRDPLSGYVDTIIDLYVDGVTSFVSVPINYSDYVIVSKLITTWLDSHMSSDGNSLHVTMDGVQVKFDKTKAFNGFPSDAIKANGTIRTPEELQTFLGDSLIFFGKASTGMIFSCQNGKTFFTIVSCDSYVKPGNGTHSQELFCDANGSYENVSSCSYCAFNRPSHIGAVCVYKDSYGRYGVEFGSPIFDGEPLRSLNSNSRSLGDADFARIIGSTATTVDVPIEKDKDFLGGAVAGSWGNLLDTVGQTGAGSLPFNVPVVDGLTLTPSAVVPEILHPAISGTGDSDIDMPDADKLKLPRMIIQKFPFCIPFDVVKGLELFAAAPKEPVFEIPFKVGEYVNETITLDFTRFSLIIRLMRWLQIILFTAGLASATRKFIKW